MVRILHQRRPGPVRSQRCGPPDVTNFLGAGCLCSLDLHTSATGAFSWESCLLQTKRIRKTVRCFCPLFGGLLHVTTKTEAIATIVIPLCFSSILPREGHYLCHVGSESICVLHCTSPKRLLQQWPKVSLGSNLSFIRGIPAYQDE